MEKQILGGSMTTLLVSTAVASAQELNVLTWEGYSDDSFITAFTEETGCAVNAIYVGSNCLTSAPMGQI
jgi:putative spermidine/putrescine transport system substrate-binding protein/spermidine/putrescine transport system substrate-binding protein